ncbi:hypothetical protein DL546_009194 [Coniochaeta pulveracea]|uniref:Kinesin-like protein n=1 Tax=Coniochaeta pulveracea TaxID=177199 RepID=A0A420YHG4_9PEZI|nr:hypothetical protein DL546_009194 [Coniochaeta pulveracea]
MTATASVRQKKTEKVDANTNTQGESMFGHSTNRRLLARPSALPSQPDVSGLSVSCDPAAEYAVMISMYEVYNDRIFDLLTPPIKSAATKEYRRRPLLFKPTEASPDRKVVAGLRKVVCGSLTQALMVLEAGLHERRVAGTGSNSVSSRSHGFFCVEVKKRAKAGRRHHLDTAWGGSTLTVVDLAGSERARDAKTAGATLAEAGKINESLMYLGQCLQMQSGAANSSKPGVVPFRQCKLTELLFSNSFPSSSSNTNYNSSTMAHSHQQRRSPQKAVMIVTADPHGDFNATSQILRYSALAREITVPRIPSITQTILHPAPQVYSSPLASPDADTTVSSQPFFSPAPPNRNFSPSSATDRETMENAALALARLAEENEYLRSALASEQTARCEAEAHLLSIEDRMLDLEQAVREDCAAEFERRLELEMARWRNTVSLEQEREEEKWGRKLEVFAATMAAEAGGMSDEEGEDKENMLVEDVNEENERLRREVEILRRELAGMSPTRRMPLRERGSEVGGKARQNKGGEKAEGLTRKMQGLRVSDEEGGGASLRQTSPTKKIRKLGGKRWDVGVEDDDLF